MINKELLMIAGGKKKITCTVQYRASKIFPVLTITDFDTDKILLHDELVDSFNKTVVLSVPQNTAIVVHSDVGTVNILMTTPSNIGYIQVESNTVMFIDLEDSNVFIELEVTM